jgi:hypothetical protein
LPNVLQQLGQLQPSNLPRAQEHDNAIYEWGKATAQLGGRAGAKALVFKTPKKSYSTEQVR